VSSKMKVLIGAVSLALFLLLVCCASVGRDGGDSYAEKTATKRVLLTSVHKVNRTATPWVLPTSGPTPDLDFGVGSGSATDKNMDACVRAAMEVLYQGPDAAAAIYVCVEQDIGTYEECADMVDGVYREVATKKCLELGY